MYPFEDFLKELHSLVQERDWAQFHSPKNLAIDLNVEASEVLEHFRWISEKESYTLDENTLAKVRDEIGDVFISLVHLSSKLGINPLKAAEEKMVKIKKKYPVDQCKGRNLKYTAYEKARQISAEEGKTEGYDCKT